MRLGARLRSGPALWAVPLTIFLAVIHVNNNPLASQGYPLAATARGASSVFVLAPIAGAIAAWEGGRLRSLGWFHLPSPRRPLSIASEALWPVPAAALVGVVVAIVASLQATGGRPHFGVAAAALAAVLGFSVLGLGIGLRLAPPIAIPAVLVGGYAWMTFPVALEPLWLRHLNGAWFSCCLTGQELSPRALTSTVLVYGAFVLVGVALSWPRAGAVVRGAVVSLVGVALAAAVAQASLLGADPSTPRPAADLECRHGAVQMCVWPEHSRVLTDAALESVAAASARWRALGLDLPQHFSEGMSAPQDEPAVRFGTTPTATTSDIVVSLAASVSQQYLSCTTDDAYEVPAPLEAGLALAVTAGVEPSELVDHYGQMAEAAPMLAFELERSGTMAAQDFVCALRRTTR